MERHMTIFQVVERDGRLMHHRASLDLFRTKPAGCRACRHHRRPGMTSRTVRAASRLAPP